MPLTSILIRVLIVSVLGAVALVVTAITLPFARPVAGLAGASVAAVIVFSLTALACAATGRRGRMPSLMLTGIAASFVAAAGWSLLVVFAHYRPISVQHWMNSLWPVTIWAVFCAITAGLYARRASSNAIAVIRGAMMVSVASVALLLVMGVWFSDEVADRYGDFLRILGALAIVTACSLVLTAMIIVLPRLLDQRAADHAGRHRLDLTVTCPRCGATQPFRTGGALCAACGLRISVVVP